MLLLKKLENKDKLDRRDFLSIELVATIAGGGISVLGIVIEQL